MTTKIEIAYWGSDPWISDGSITIYVRRSKYFFGKIEVYETGGQIVDVVDTLEIALARLKGLDTDAALPD